MKKKVLPVSLNESQFKYLREYAAVNDVSMALVIRELINKDMKGGNNE